MAGRQLWVSMIVCVCATMALFGVIAGSAGALQTRLLQEGFGQDGTPSTGFFYPLSVGLDQSTGNVYVGSADGTARKFAPVHVSEAFSGIAPNISEGNLTGFGNYAEVHQIAVSSYTAGAAAHDIYVVGENSSVAAYQPDGEPAQFTAGPDSGTNELKGSEVCGVAVETSGDIYVSEFSTGVHIFSESGESITSIPVPDACNLGVDSSGVLYVNTLSGPQNGQSGPILKFTPSNLPPVTAATTFEANGAVGSNPSQTLTVDPSDDHLFADEGGQVTEYDQTGSPVDTFGAGATGDLVGSQGIAVNDVSEQVYVANTQGSQRQVEIFGPVVTLPDVTTEPASSIEPQGSAMLNGRVKPDGIALTACQFEYVEAALYESSAANPYAAGAIAQCEPAAGAIPTAGETEVHAGLSGLPPGVRYDYRLVASNKTASDKNPSSYGANVELVLPPLPTIEAADASNLTRNSAELSVRINPGSLSTTYHFEYDTTPFAPGEPEGSHGTSVGAGELAANAGSTEIGPLTITDLKEDKTYYWRVVATNAAGTTLGEDHTFIYDTSGEGLPDHRAYEMVTPPHKNAALIGGGTHVTQVAEDGSRVSTVTFQCFGDAESCVPLHYLDLGQPVLFTRGSSGWTANALQPPASEFASDGYLKSDPETGMALFSIPTPPMFEEDIYAREPSGEFEDVGPLTPPSEGPQPEPFSSAGKGADVNATSDFSHVAYENVTLGQAVQYSGFNDQAPNLVGVSGGQGSKDLISQCRTALGSFEGVSPGEMSEDGETVYFTAGSVAGGCAAGGTGANAGKVVPVNELFARVGGGTANARTVALSEPSAFSAAAPYPGCEKEPCVKDVNEQANWRGAEFEGASADGSKAFFLSDQQLTDNATEGQGNLYEYDFDDPSEAGRLIDVSAGDTSGLGPRCRVCWRSAPTARMCISLRDGILSSAPNGLGETAKVGADNLYVFERDTSYPDGRTAFVTQLAESDGEEWGAQVPPGNAERNSLQGDANVTPDGRYLVFESRGRLTPDTTRPEGGPTQIYRYDAQTGELGACLDRRARVQRQRQRRAR